MLCSLSLSLSLPQSRYSLTTMTCGSEYAKQAKAYRDFWPPLRNFMGRVARAPLRRYCPRNDRISYWFVTCMVRGIRNIILKKIILHWMVLLCLVSVASCLQNCIVRSHWTDSGLAWFGFDLIAAILHTCS